MAKKKTTSKRRAAPPTKAERAAELRREAARLEGDEDDDEDDDDEEEERDRHPLTLAEKGQVVSRAIERGLDMLGSLGKMIVSDETTPNQKGDSLPFQRHAGHVRGVKLDGQGRVKEVDFQPEEWPPRREGF